MIDPKNIGFDPKTHAETPLSPDELRTIVDDAGPLIPKRHQGMLLNILELEDVTVEDIMIPRTEVVGLDLDDDDNTLLEQLRSVEFTRIPVYQDDINNIVGVLHQRNVSRVINENGALDRRLLRRQMVDPFCA